MAESQFQHHVPKFYLNGWQTSVNGLHKRVWVYEKGIKPRPSAIRRTGGRPNTYAVAQSDGSFDLKTVEEYLGSVESQAGIIFAKILKHKPLLPIEKTIMARFISIMFRRDPYTLDAFAPKHLTPMLPVMREKRRQELLNLQGLNRREEVIQILDQAYDLFEKHPNSATSLAILYSEPQGTRMFEELNWCFAYSNSCHFLTSDSPVVFNRRAGIGNFAHGHVIFPISKNLLIWMTRWPITQNIYFEVSKPLVETINRNIIRNAYKQVFSDCNKSNIEDCVNTQLSVGLPAAEGTSAS